MTHSSGRVYRGCGVDEDIPYDLRAVCARLGQVLRVGREPVYQIAK